MAQMVKNMPPMGKAPEKGMAIHSTILTQRIPWTEEPGRLQSMGSQSERTYTTEQAVKLSGSVWRSSCLFIQIMLVFAPYPCILILFF